MEAREKEIGKRAGHDEKGKERREAVLGGFSGVSGKLRPKT